MEMKLKTRYQKISGRNNNNNETCDSNGRDSDESGRMICNLMMDFQVEFGPEKQHVLHQAEPH